MGNRYQRLMSEQRNQLQRGLNEGLSIRAVARQMERSPNTVSENYTIGTTRRVRRGSTVQILEPSFYV